MIPFDDMLDMLDDVACEFPREFFIDLNGGINLVKSAKRHPKSGDTHELYIMGQYFFDPYGLGRYINIYYGSLVRVYGNLDADLLKEELKKLLSHEFTHHIESLAGERGLEKKDMRELNALQGTIRKQ